MGEIDELALRRVINEVLDVRRGVDEYTHRKQHEQFGQVDWEHFKLMVEADRDRRRRIEKLKTQIWGWALLSMLGGLAYAIGEAARHFFNRG